MIYMKKQNTIFKQRKIVVTTSKKY